MSNEESLMDTRQAAAYLSVSVRCVEQWRFKKRGPRYVKIEGSVRYRRSDLDDFMEVIEPGGK